MGSSGLQSCVIHNKILIVRRSSGGENENIILNVFLYITGVQPRVACGHTYKLWMWVL
jgi:hypothetical protein